ncbi:MAG: TIGR02186 family protein [Desulfurivibrionaceae bacterium]
MLTLKRTFIFSLRCLVLCGAAFFGFITLPASAEQPLTCAVTPGNIPITFTYHGAQLTVTGQSAIGDDLVVTISTEPEDALLKYKAKVGGLVWMKKGDLEFKGVPAIYLLHSTAELTRILGEAERNQHQLGYDALRQRVVIEDSQGNPAEGKWFDEYLKFKNKEMVYDIKEGAVTRQHGEEGNTYRASIAWPYQAPPGIYTVRVFAVRDGRVVAKAADQFEVKRVGITAALSKMAFEHAAWYGIMAVVIALFAGLAVGAIFKKGGGSH